MPHDFQSDIDAIERIPAVKAILEVICRTTGMGFAAVARVTGDRWVALEVHDEIRFGLEPGGELKVQTTICNEVRGSGEPVIIDDVSQDKIYCGHPTPKMYGFQSYISMPIRLPDGEFFGTLCSIDPSPAKLTNTQAIPMFRLFAELIAFHLDAHRRLQATEESLLSERAGSELREQFIAVLGHDLRNPLASIDSGTRLLLRGSHDARTEGILKLMQSSVIRMSGLIDNVMDFARGRLGGGLLLNFDRTRSVEGTLEQVVSEIRSAFPERRIETSIGVETAMAVDHPRLAQMFSNLLANAVTHGAPDRPILVAAQVDGTAFELAVANGGQPIPEAAMAHLFQPFYRSGTEENRQGLGLGLFIAREIALAHGGDISVASTDAETRFTFRMPVTPAS